MNSAKKSRFDHGSDVVRHPWDYWLKRRVITLSKGVHFDCQPHSMAQQVRNAAFARGISVSVGILGDEVTVTRLS